MVHFPGFARARLWIKRAVPRVYRGGFPHSEIPGSKPVCGSPRLIAASHVLHRLLLPRHPPCALSSLTIKLIQRRILAWLCSQTQILRCQFYSPYWICSSRTSFLRKLPPQQISKVLIKYYSALNLPCIYPIYSVVKHRPAVRTATPPRRL